MEGKPNEDCKIFTKKQNHVVENWNDGSCRGNNAGNQLRIKHDDKQCVGNNRTAGHDARFDDGTGADGNSNNRSGSRRSVMGDEHRITRDKNGDESSRRRSGSTGRGKFYQPDSRIFDSVNEK